MKKFLSVFLIIFLSTISLQAQEHHGHHHARNEIGLSGGAIYSFDHSSWGGGLHFHYYRTFGDHSKWSFGAMAEQVWVDGGHTTLGAGIKYQISDRFSVGVLPGITFLKHDEHEDHGDHSHSHSENKTQFSMHFELVYDLFHWEKFHLGPVVDFSWSKDDSHGMIGVHAAFTF